MRDDDDDDDDDMMMMMMMMVLLTTIVVMTGDVRLHTIIVHADEREDNCDDMIKPSAWSLYTLQAMQTTPSLLSAERLTATGCPPLPESTPNSAAPPPGVRHRGKRSEGRKVVDQALTPLTRTTSLTALLVDNHYCPLGGHA